MLKLTRKLFALQPDVRFAEFHEQALFNHILGSMDPGDGATCYMVPVGRGVRREYADMSRSFTCCVGTGMESHALHGLGVYYEAGDRLWVNLFVPSTATWEAAGIKLATETAFPDGDSATLAIDARAPRAFTLAVRRPSWAGDGFAVSVNGEPVASASKPGSYVELNRTWRSGDRVKLAMPKTLRLARLGDNPQKAAVMWGPLVLAGDLGVAERRRSDGDGDGPADATADAPVLVTERDVSEWLSPVSGQPGAFRTTVARSLGDSPAGSGESGSRTIEFTPFFRTHRRVYGAYWDLLTPAQYETRLVELAAERARVRALEAATIAFVPVGRPDGEKAFNQQGEETSIVRADGRPGRRAAKWFAFDVPVDPARPTVLVVTYNSDNRRDRSFAIHADGERVAEQRLAKSSVSRFVDIEYPLPATIVNGKPKLTVRFEATNGNEVAPVFGIRTVRRGG